MRVVFKPQPTLLRFESKARPFGCFTSQKVRSLYIAASQRLAIMQGFYRGNTEILLGLHWDDAKENGNYCLGFRDARLSPKEYMPPPHPQISNASRLCYALYAV